jgi:hypothetical protein
MRIELEALRACGQENLQVSAEASASAEIVLSIDARARRLLDLWGNGVYTARAQGFSQATARSTRATIPKLRLHVLLFRFRLNVLLTARAHFQVVATASVLDQMIIRRSACTVTRLVGTTTSKVDRFFELRLNGVNFATVAFWFENAITKRVRLFLHLGNEQWFRSRAASRLCAWGRCGGGEHVFGRAGDLNRARRSSAWIASKGG